MFTPDLNPIDVSHISKQIWKSKIKNEKSEYLFDELFWEGCFRGCSVMTIKVAGLGRKYLAHPKRFLILT